MAECFKLDPAATALILVDLQHGIVGLPLAPRVGAAVVERAALIAAAFHAHGAVVVHVRVDLAAMEPRPVDRLLHDPAAPPPPPEASTLVSGVDRPEGDLSVVKRRWGAFAGTGLDEQLRRRGVDTVVVAGIATNLGVESTARAAADLGYSVVFAEDAMSSISAEAHAFAVGTIFPLMGRVRGSDEIRSALAA